MSGLAICTKFIKLPVKKTDSGLKTQFTGEMEDIFTNTDVIRAAFCASTRKSRADALPVHIHSISNLSQKFGVEAYTTEALSNLETLGEISHLGNGYWIGAPNRLINLGEWKLLLTPNPTTEIRTWLTEEILIGGIGRFIRGNLPKIDLIQPDIEWKSTPDDLLKWALNEAAIAKVASNPISSVSVPLQVYAPWNSKQSGKFQQSNVMWVDTPNLNFPKGLDFTLARESLGSFSKYSIVFLKNGKLVSISQNITDSVRIGFAIDMILGVASIFDVSYEQQSVRLKIPRILPRIEKEVLLATAIKITESFQEYVVPLALFPIVEKYLSKLGLRRLKHV